jgi:lysophospholipase
MTIRDEGFFSATDGSRLYWQSLLPDGRAEDIIGLVHGYGDHSGRYAATMQSLVARGHGVMAFDFRGHGRSDGRRADVARWTDYVADLAVFWGHLSVAAKGLPTFLVAHSNGALVATHWALQPPVGLRGLVMSAPFYRLAFEPPLLKLLAAKVLLRLVPGLHLSNQLDPAQLSRDETWQRATAADELYLHVTTPRWFFATMAAQRQLASRGRDFTVPLFALVGLDDPVASVEASRAFYATVASSDKTWKEYGGMRHEVLNEIGKEQVVDDISRWISAHR